MASKYKIETVDQLTRRFENSSGIYFTCYTGMDVSQATELRRMFRDSGVDFFISKNTLTKIAASNAGYEDKLNDFLKGQVAIAYSINDAVSPARSIKTFLKDEVKASLEVLGVVFEGEIFSPDKYKELADLPTKEVLISQFLSVLCQPMTKFAGTLNGAMQSMVGVLNNLKEKK